MNQQHNPLNSSLLPVPHCIHRWQRETQSVCACVCVCVLHHQQFFKNNYLTPTASAAEAELLLYTSSEEQRCQLLTGNSVSV